MQVYKADYQDRLVWYILPKKWGKRFSWVFANYYINVKHFTYEYRTDFPPNKDTRPIKDHAEEARAEDLIHYLFSASKITVYRWKDGERQEE